MKIQLLSDLHNEFYRPSLPLPIEQTEADIVVLAGDIDIGLQGLVWARDEAVRLGKTLLYVAGNHEFYHHDIALLDEMRAFAADSDNLHFLENDQLIVDATRFIGCTLWTDYLAAGDQVLSMMEVQQVLRDHHVISHGERRFIPADALKLHLESRSWLEEKLSQPFEGKTVVITHHAPHLLCHHPSFPLDAIGTAFFSDLSGLVEKADVWCFGHTHSNFEQYIGDCRLISNQRGYPGEGVKGFDPKDVMTI